MRLPTLPLHGNDDRIRPPAEARALANGLPQAQLQLIPGLGPVPRLNAPRGVARLIEAHCTCAADLARHAAGQCEASAVRS